MQISDCKMKLEQDNNCRLPKLYTLSSQDYNGEQDILEIIVSAPNLQYITLNQAEVSNKIMNVLDSKKLVSLGLIGNIDLEDPEKREAVTTSGAALIAKHADNLGSLSLFGLKVDPLFGNKQLVDIEQLSLYDCSGKLETVVGLCRKLEYLKIVNSDLKIQAAGFSLSSLKYLITKDCKMTDEDKAKLRALLPANMIRNDLDDNVPAPEA